MISALTAFVYTTALTAGLLLGDGSQRTGAALIGLLMVWVVVRRRRRRAQPDLGPTRAPSRGVARRALSIRALSE